MTMNVVYKPINEIVPYENNPRHNESAIDMVANSIKEFGFKVPIVIDKDNVIVAGHTRLKAAYKLEMTEVPCLVADDLTDEQIRAYRLADNKVSEFSNWDFSLLEQELDAIEMDMNQFGFKELEVVNIDDLFVENEDEPKDKEPKMIQCPHCGEWFEA